jgi:hypothetical protein
VSVTVNNIAAAVPAASVQPGTDTSNSQSVITASNGQSITNGTVATTVSGFVTLDASNITNAAKERTIAKTEYYESGILLQTDIAMPFVLDSSKLSNGSHTISEITYFNDGSRSQVTRVLSVNNIAAAAKKSNPGAAVGVGVTIVVLLVVLGVGVFFLRRNHITVSSLRAKYGNSIDTSLIDQR